MNKVKTKLFQLFSSHTTYISLEVMHIHYSDIVYMHV